MDRYNNYMYQNNRYGRPNDFRAKADRSDRRYDDFYADRSGRGGVRRSGDWDRQPRYNRRGGRGGPYPGDKRRTDDVRRYSPSSKRRTTGSVSSRDSPRKEKEEIIIEDDDIPDDEVVVPDSLMDSVERLRMRKEIERNVADEDIEKLCVFCFTGKGYQCKTCGFLLTKKSAFSTHLMGKSHVMNVIEARTAKTYKEIRDILDIDLSPDDWFEKNDNAQAIIMKQSKLHMKNEREVKKREQANYNKTPSNFYSFDMKLRKSVTKKEEKVVITSLVESTVEVNEFTGEKYFGCEFVRAVTGFHCRLCSINIREARGVIPHIDCRRHRENYAEYVKKNPGYEKTQNKHNKDLFDVMSQHEEENVVLAESSDVEKSHFLSLLDTGLVRIPSVMNPELKEEKEKNEMKENQEDEDEDVKKNKKNESDKPNAEHAKEANDAIDDDDDDEDDDDIDDVIDDEDDNDNDAADDESDEVSEVVVIDDDDEGEEDEVKKDADREAPEEDKVEEDTVEEPMEDNEEEDAEGKNESGEENEADPDVEIKKSELTKNATNIEKKEPPKLFSKKAKGTGITKTHESPKTTSKKAIDEELQKTTEKETSKIVKEVTTQETESQSDSTEESTTKSAAQEDSNDESPLGGFEVVDEVKDDTVT